MVELVLKTVKGKKYAYLEESIRIGSDVRKVSKYIGPDKKITKTRLNETKRMFKEGLLQKKLDIILKIIQKKFKKFEYPLNREEVKKIELMNLKYKEIIKNLHKKDLQDLNKRFIANYVFETNALEGNSLTLKNVTEIVFEKRISKGKDLREIYDAQNSYKTYLLLQKSRKRIDHNFIIKIHFLLMKNIDDRLNYRKIPAYLLGKPTTKLTNPENVYKEMAKLLSWYKNNENKLYPLELAFKFHAKFERIHPFCDGNGRVGRLLLNYILIRKGHSPVIIRKTTRSIYIRALEAADKEVWIVLMRFALKHYKETFQKFFGVYYKYAKK